MFIFIFLLFFISFASSCVINDSIPSLEWENNRKVMDYVHKGFLMSIIPMTPHELESYHGSDAMIFNETLRVYPPEKILVLHCRISSDDNIILQYDKITLVSQTGIFYQSQTRREFSELWEKRISLSRKDSFYRLIDETIFPEKIMAKTKNKKEGYMVFILSEDRIGEFLLNIPIYSRTSGSGTLLLPVNLDIDKKTIPEENIKIDGPVFIPIDS